MKLFFPFLLIVFAVVAWSGCDMINPEEQTPTYVHIDSFSFVPTAGNGTSSHKITNVWVYLDNVSLGAFDLPVTFPVITGKPGVITMTPAVAYSGLKGVTTIYPYYKSDTFTLIPDPGHVVNFIPQTQYYSDSDFNFHEEDFEGGNSFIKYDGDTTIIRTADPGYVFEGTYSGYIHLNSSQTFAESISNYAFTTGNAPFLEMDYKCSVPFGVGLQTISNNQSVVQYIVTLRPKAEWNKVYIGLQDFVNVYQNSSYRVIIKAIRDTASEGYIAIDNLKVISSK